MNQYDSERIAQVMAREGYVPTERMDSADLDSAQYLQRARQGGAKGLQRARKVERIQTISGRRRHRRRRLRGAAGRREPAQTGAAPRSGFRHAQYSQAAGNGRASRSRSAPGWWKPPSTAIRLIWKTPTGELRSTAPKRYVTIMQGCNKVVQLLHRAARARPRAQPAERQRHRRNRGAW